MSHETLHGERKVPVAFADGQSATDFTVKQFRIGDYQKALALYADEIGLVAFACGKIKKEIESLEPESYERLHAAVQELNEKGFFVYAARQEKRGQEMISAMPPEMVQAAFGRFLSPPPSPGLPPVPR
ncbi:MAG TPA: hypothetical protein VHY30_01585 [Verrucomicrobiae bacterium]|jgi:hypothetical protein|nr:hypothetical protein [Verrucomicrobiae bacterium]